jgi:flagellar motor switch protein FliG
MNEEQIQHKPFDFINHTDPALLLNYLYKEHPQVIALVLAHLEPNKAPVILQNFPHELQSDVTKRIACMDSTPWDIVRGIEQVIEKKLSTLSEESLSSVGGVDSVVELLSLVDRASEKQIIEAMEDDDPELAE